MKSSWMNRAAYIFNVAVTFGIGVFQSPTHAELSEKYQTLVTPVSWTFAIMWSLIFAMQAAWVVLAPHHHHHHSGYVWIVLAQAAWTITFSQECIVASMCSMMALAYCLWTAVAELPTPVHNLKEYILVHVPLRLHAGWITAATVVNANVVLVYAGVSPHSQWIASLLSLGVLLTVAVSEVKDCVIPLVLALAALGIAQELASPKVFIRYTFPARQIAQVQQAASLAAMTIAAVVVVRMGMRLTHRRFAEEHP